MIGKTKILIVEDDVPLAMQMVAALTKAGCNVKAVCTGKKGKTLATMKKFDLIVLDAVLPDINSLEICDDLKQRHISKHTPIVFVGNGSDDVQQCVEHGAVDFIAKPFGTEFVPRLLSHIKPTATVA
jgi:cyclic di-GMP phosphodiesterase